MPLGTAVQLHLPPLQELALTPPSHINATGSERRQAPLKARHQIVNERLAIHRATGGKFQ